MKARDQIQSILIALKFGKGLVGISAEAPATFEKYMNILPSNLMSWGFRVCEIVWLKFYRISNGARVSRR